MPDDDVLTWPAKDPDEELDYTINWEDRLDPPADVIVASEWFVSPIGLTKTTDFRAAMNTTVWLSGGALGQTYKVRNRILTTEGRTMEQTVRLLVKTR